MDKRFRNDKNSDSWWVRWNSRQDILDNITHKDGKFICGFGGIRLKIEMDLKMAKTKIDFLIYHPTVTVACASSL